MKIACLVNHPAEGPGLIAHWAQDRGHTVTPYAAYESIFPQVEDFDALVVMGGPQSVHDVADNAGIAGAMQTIRNFLEAEKKVFGVCLGAQMLAVELGGDVIDGEEKEVGWYPITIQDLTTEHCLSDLPIESVVFHWHGEHIELPPGVRLLASSHVCPVQAFETEAGSLGLQCHLEVDSAAMETMVRAFGGEVSVGGPGLMSPAEMELGLQKWGSGCRQYLFAILDRWGT